MVDIDLPATITDWNPGVLTGTVHMNTIIREWHPFLYQFKLNIMKIQFKSMLLCIAVSFIVFTGCKKPSPPIATTIEQVSLTVDKNNTETGTFNYLCSLLY